MLTRLFISLGLLALSATLAHGQPDPPRLACSVLQAQWASSWPDSSRSRSLDENRQYESGYRVGSPIDIDGAEPTSWHNLSFNLVNQPSPISFYLNKVSGQIQTYSERFDHEQRSSYPLSVEAWLQGGPKNRKNPSGAQKYCNERFTSSCGDCRLQTITVNVSISDEPERPEQPRAPRAGGMHGSLTVSWDRVATNPAINTYDVQWRAGPGGPFVAGPQGVIGTSATIENLDAHFNYQVRIRATNSLGVSPWSATTPARTTPPPVEPPPVEPPPVEPPPVEPPPVEPPPVEPPPVEPPPVEPPPVEPPPVEPPPVEPPPVEPPPVEPPPVEPPPVEPPPVEPPPVEPPPVEPPPVEPPVVQPPPKKPPLPPGPRQTVPEAPEVLDFAHFANGTGITSDFVLVNLETAQSGPARTPFDTTILPSRPVIYFYDTKGNLIDPALLVDLTGDMEITEDGALTIRTEMEPLGVLTISTHGRGALMTGSVRAVSYGPIGGGVRYDIPNLGVAGVGASPPLSDALFPVRRQEGGITTGVALHNLESSPGLVRCDLMRKGVVLDAASIPLAANGQTSWFIDQAFTSADTSDFAGAVRCATRGSARFTAVALEMDPGNGIFTALPVLPVPR